MKKVKLAIVGVGNCASSLVQGIEYYKHHHNELTDGIMQTQINGWRPQDIEIVAAFDIDKRKVGLPIEEAIFGKPNCTKVFQEFVEPNGVKVMMGPVLDGIANHMNDYPNSQSFRVADVKPVNVVEELKNSGAEALVCYLPVGSQKAVEFYANACLQAKVGMVNCMPVFIASNKEWANKFKEAGVPIIGDDIKSQVGATIVHRVISRLFNDRGCKILRTYQLNTGGNTDFLNMLEKSRLKSKKISKTGSVQSQLDVPLDAKNIHIGPSDYVPWQKDNKIAFIRIEGEGFGGAPIELEMRLSVQDSPNSAGVVIDAIRCVALARERGLAGPINSVSSYYMKTPPEQYRDSIALELTNDFIKGKISEADNRIIVTEETIKQKKPTIHRLQTLN